MTESRTLVQLPFLAAVESEELSPLDTARLFYQRAQALDVALAGRQYSSGIEGCVCLIGLTALDAFAQANNSDLIDGELINWFEAAIDYEHEDVERPRTFAQMDIYTFIMDATQQTDFNTLEQLERGFESNGVNYHANYDLDAYGPRIAELSGFGHDPLNRMSYDQRERLYNDRAPAHFSASQQQMWDSEPYAFKVGYLLRLLSMDIIA